MFYAGANLGVGSLGSCLGRRFEGAVFVSCCGKMLKQRYILNFIIDAKFNIQNKIFVISVLGLGGMVFDSAWGVIPPPTKETLLEIGGRNFFTA
jgi:hypothetical protein